MPQCLIVNRHDAWAIVMGALICGTGGPLVGAVIWALVLTVVASVQGDQSTAADAARTMYVLLMTVILVIGP
jgi:hypothetical protein